MFAPYQPRPLEFLGIDTVAGYRLKTYSIRYGVLAFDRRRFDEGWALAKAALPQPATADGRPGVGFAILHQGRTSDYFILCWWDHENELPIRVFVRGPEGWRPAKDGESVCVWDLRVLWWEREAYVNTVMAGGEDGLEDYLGRAAKGNA
jgi:hypothetical protein